MSNPPNSPNALLTLQVNSELKSLITKVEIDPKKREIHIYFKKTLNRYGRSFFRRNLARCLQKRSYHIPIVIPEFSKSKEDTSQHRFHRLTERWSGLLVDSALPRVHPLWKDIDSIPYRSEYRAFINDAENLFDEVLDYWNRAMLPFLPPHKH